MMLIEILCVLTILSPINLLIAYFGVELINFLLIIAYENGDSQKAIDGIK